MFVLLSVQANRDGDQGGNRVLPGGGVPPAGIYRCTYLLRVCATFYSRRAGTTAGSVFSTGVATSLLAVATPSSWHKHMPT